MVGVACVLRGQGGPWWVGRLFGWLISWLVASFVGTGPLGSPPHHNISTGTLTPTSTTTPSMQVGIVEVGVPPRQKENPFCCICLGMCRRARRAGVDAEAAEGDVGGRLPRVAELTQRVEGRRAALEVGGSIRADDQCFALLVSLRGAFGGTVIRAQRAVQIGHTVLSMPKYLW